MKQLSNREENNSNILQMIALGKPAQAVYKAIALMYEAKYPGMRCSMLELDGDTLLHGGAPSLPVEYSEAMNGLKIGPNIGSCGTSTYTGKRCLVEDIATDPKWANIKHLALPHGLRCCWSEPIKSSTGKVLGAFGMYYNAPGLPNKQQSDDLDAAAGLASLVMERDQNQKRIKTLAYTDELTGVANRARFYLDLEQCLAKASRSGNKFCLIYMDLDDFKNVNDSLGHDTGDQMLKIIAQRLQSVDDIEFIARLSGDEFCMITYVADPLTVADLANRLMAAINQPLELSARTLFPLCSMGITCFPTHASDVGALIKAADTALYEAKAQGKNGFAFYEPELSQKLEARLQTERFLRDAIEAKQLNLVYQSLIDLASGELVGVEALCRWQHPVIGVVAK